MSWTQGVLHLRMYVWNRRNDLHWLYEVDSVRICLSVSLHFYLPLLLSEFLMHGGVGDLPLQQVMLMTSS